MAQVQSSLYEPLEVKRKNAPQGLFLPLRSHPLHSRKKMVQSPHRLSPSFLQPVPLFGKGAPVPPSRPTSEIAVACAACQRGASGTGATRRQSELLRGDCRAWRGATL